MRFLFLMPLAFFPGQVLSTLSNSSAYLIYALGQTNRERDTGLGYGRATRYG